MWHFLLLVVLKDSQKLKEEDEMLFHMKLFEVGIWHFPIVPFSRTIYIYIYINMAK